MQLEELFQFVLKSNERLNISYVSGQELGSFQKSFSYHVLALWTTLEKMVDLCGALS